MPNSSMFGPTKGDGTKEVIWSVITIKSPGLKSLSMPPAALVRIRFFAPSIFIILIGVTTCSIE